MTEKIKEFKENHEISSDSEDNNKENHEISSDSGNNGDDRPYKHALENSKNFERKNKRI